MRVGPLTCVTAPQTLSLHVNRTRPSGSTSQSPNCRACSPKALQQSSSASRLYAAAATSAAAGARHRRFPLLLMLLLQQLSCAAALCRALLLLLQQQVQPPVLLHRALMLSGGGVPRAQTPGGSGYHLWMAMGCVLSQGAGKQVHDDGGMVTMTWFQRVSGVREGLSLKLQE